MHRFLLLAVALACLAPVASAQNHEGHGDHAPDSTSAQDEEAAVLAVVTELWDAMRAGDGERVGALLHPEARGFSVTRHDGHVMLTQDDPKVFAEIVGVPHDEAYDERVANEEVRVDGPFATYYADYEFWLGARRSHCGVDAFQLVKTDGAWKILVLSDTRRPCE